MIVLDQSENAVIGMISHESRPILMRLKPDALSILSADHIAREVCSLGRIPDISSRQLD